MSTSLKANGDTSVHLRMAQKVAVVAPERKEKSVIE